MFSIFFLSSNTAAVSSKQRYVTLVPLTTRQSLSHRSSCCWGQGLHPGKFMQMHNTWTWENILTLRIAVLRKKHTLQLDTFTYSWKLTKFWVISVCSLPPLWSSHSSRIVCVFSSRKESWRSGWFPDLLRFILAAISSWNDDDTVHISRVLLNMKLQ